MSCVYFIENSGFVKIGFSRDDDPCHRITSMKTNAPIEPRIAGYITLPGSGHDRARILESRLHEAFDYCHTRAEWFAGKPVLEWLYQEFCTEGELTVANEAFDGLEEWSMYINVLPGYENWLPVIDAKMNEN